MNIDRARVYRTFYVSTQVEIPPRMYSLPPPVVTIFVNILSTLIVHELRGYAALIIINRELQQSQSTMLGIIVYTSPNNCDELLTTVIPLDISIRFRYQARHYTNQTNLPPFIILYTYFFFPFFVRIDYIYRRNPPT